MKNKRVDFSFSKSSLKYLLFSKKKCPNCGYPKMERIIRENYIGKGENITPTHFGEKPDAYNGTIFYKCSKCKSIYSLEDLGKSKPIKTNEQDLVPKSSRDENISEKTPQHTKGTKRFFDLVAVTMSLMVMNIAIGENDMLVALVFIPIIMFFWLISRLMLR